MKQKSKVKILQSASSQFGRSGERELFNFLEFLEENSDYLSSDHAKAETYFFPKYGEAIVVPYSEAGRFKGDFRRKDEYGKILPFGTQNWVHLGNLACELFRPPPNHSDHFSIKMRQLFLERPNTLDQLVNSITPHAKSNSYDDNLATYLQRVRFNHA